LVSVAKKVSTALSDEHEAGVKVKRGWRASQARRCDRRQPRAILSTDGNDDPLAHPADSHDREPAGILNGLVC
jgi:hypothetical protein